jgi:predicted aconitase with swiveling domain
MTTLPVALLVSGTAQGPVSCLDAPLSLWGGYDIAEGVIIDATHPNRGQELAGRIVAMEARGSSSSSSTLLEAARSGTAPAAIILPRADAILTIGSLVAMDLYQVSIPIVLLDAQHWATLGQARHATLDPTSAILILD